MADQPSMDDILDDKEPDKPEPAAQPENPEPSDQSAKEASEEKEKQDRRDSYMSKRQQARNKEAIAQGKVLDPDTGQFVFPKEKKEEKKEEPKAEVKEEKKEEKAPEVTKPPAQEFTDKEKAFLRAAQEERNKRQELERRLAAIEASKPKEAEKTFWDDPEAALAKQRQEIQQTIVGTRLQTSEAIARTRYQDFDEKVAKFAEIVQTAPWMTQQMLSAPDPAEFVYRTAKNHIEIQTAGGIDELKKKIEADTEAKVRARIEAELKEKAEALARARAELPGSRSEAKATGGATKPVWAGPPSFDDILNDK